MIYCSLRPNLINAPVSYEELAGGFEPIRNGKIFCINNKREYTTQTASLITYHRAGVLCVWSVLRILAEINTKFKTESFNFPLAVHYLSNGIFPSRIIEFSSSIDLISPLFDFHILT